MVGRRAVAGLLQWPGLPRLPLPTMPDYFREEGTVILELLSDLETLLNTNKLLRARPKAERVSLELRGKI